MLLLKHRIKGFSFEYLLRFLSIIDIHNHTEKRSTSKILPECFKPKKKTMKFEENFVEPKNGFK